MIVCNIPTGQQRVGNVALSKVVGIEYLLLAATLRPSYILQHLFFASNEYALACLFVSFFYHPHRARINFGVHEIGTSFKGKLVRFFLKKRCIFQIFLPSAEEKK
jgi:hypothetical protein